MGIIIKQSLKGSIWSYIGLVLGYINLGVIMPNFMDPEQIGLLQIFASLSLVFAQFSTLGFTSVINRIFPVFRNKLTNHNGFLFLIFFVGLLGFLINVIAFIVLKPYIIETNIDKSPLFVEYLYVLIPLVFFRLLFSLLDNYNKMLYDSVTGIFWNEFLHKGLNLVLVGLYAFGFIQFNQFFYGYVFSLSMPVFPIIVLLIKRGEFNLRPNRKFLTLKLKKEIAQVSLFGLIIGFSGILVTNVDKIIVSHYLSLEQLGIFSVCTLFATVIRIPIRSVHKISTPIISESWKNNDINNIQKIYYQSSINLLVIGFLLYIGLYINLENIFMILPKAYEQGKLTLLIYALGILFYSAMGVGNFIIATSDYYRVAAYVMIFVIASTIVNNIIFIPIYGINGSAFATMLTFFMGSAVRIAFLKIKYGLFCFSRKHLYLLGLTIFVILFDHFFIPTIKPFYLDIFVTSFLVTILYISLVLLFRISEEFSQMFQSILEKIGGLKR